MSVPPLQHGPFLPSNMVRSSPPTGERQSALYVTESEGRCIPQRCRVITLRLEERQSAADSAAFKGELDGSILTVCDRERVPQQTVKDAVLSRSDWRSVRVRQIRLLSRASSTGAYIQYVTESESRRNSRKMPCYHAPKANKTGVCAFYHQNPQ